MIDQDVVEDLLGQLELSFVNGETHWKHGGIVGVFGYGGGVIGRYSDQQERVPLHCPLPHHAREPACQQVLQLGLPENPLRPLGVQGKRHDEPPRVHRGHHFPRDHHRATGAHLFRIGPRGSAGPRRIRLQPANPFLLHRQGPLRMGLYRHPGNVL
jgi:hypothetical protein